MQPSPAKSKSTLTGALADAGRESQAADEAGPLAPPSDSPAPPGTGRAATSLRRRTPSRMQEFIPAADRGQSFRLNFFYRQVTKSNKMCHTDLALAPFQPSLQSVKPPTPFTFLLADPRSGRRSPSGSKRQHRPSASVVHRPRSARLAPRSLCPRLYAPPVTAHRRCLLQTGTGGTGRTQRCSSRT